jgi:uncharacterized protein
MTSINGARALVTGANGGIGAAICGALRDRGAEIIATGRRPAEVEAVAKEVDGKAIVADLSVRSELVGLLDEAGEIDIFVANAALPASGDIADWSQEQIDRVIEVNLAGPIVTTNALLPMFRKRGSGHFVYISSLSGKVPARSSTMYAATKFGLRGFAGSLRCDLHGSGIGCSVIFPGFVRDAGMFADTGVSLPRGVGTVSPDAVAAAVVRAIDRDKAEIDVAPIGLRVGAFLGALVPGLSPAIQARVDRGFSDRMTAAQREKR